MKKKMVSYTLDTLPPVTDKQQTNLIVLGARYDSDIDTSDIPEMTDEQWNNAARSHFYRPAKRG